MDQGMNVDRSLDSSPNSVTPDHGVPTPAYCGSGATLSGLIKNENLKWATRHYHSIPSSSSPIGCPGGASFGSVGLITCAGFDSNLPICNTAKFKCARCSVPAVAPPVPAHAFNSFNFSD